MPKRYRLKHHQLAAALLVIAAAVVAAAWIPARRAASVNLVEALRTD